MSVLIERRQDPEACREILGALPDWFGIPESTAEYVADAGRLPSYLARRDGRVRGLALVRRHFAEAAELHLIAVRPREHRSGIGTALLGAVENDLRADGVQFLQVKTVGPSYEHAGYARTRAFYRAAGFSPLEEVRGLGWDGPMLIQVKTL